LLNPSRVDVALARTSIARRGKPSEALGRAVPRPTIEKRQSRTHVRRVGG
jgi:hypothetical protein